MAPSRTCWPSRTAISETTPPVGCCIFRTLDSTSARLNSRQTQKELLGQQIEQLQQQIAGLDAQIRAKSIQRDLALTQLQSVQGLYEKRLVPLMRLTTVQGDIARLEGEQGQLVSAIAEARSKISEQKLQIVRIDQDFRADVMKELREAQAKEAELVERSISAKDVFDRVEIRAPTSGVVHQLAAHTIGGVVGPGEVIMEIVPDADTLEVDARLKPTEIDQVRIGQKSRVSFPAFNRQMTPELTGVVSYISADLSHDKQSNATYYTVKVSLPGAELRRLGDLRLVSGMPVEAFLEAGTRTMISYLFKPITDQLRRAFKER
jgi:HlyD family secretion protein